AAARAAGASRGAARAGMRGVVCAGRGATAVALDGGDEGEVESRTIIPSGVGVRTFQGEPMLRSAIGLTALLLLASPPPTAPRFVVDPMWPNPMPNRWILGSATGVAVDARDHIYV